MSRADRHRQRIDTGCADKYRGFVWVSIQLDVVVGLDPIGSTNTAKLSLDRGTASMRVSGHLTRTGNILGEWRLRGVDHYRRESGIDRSHNRSHVLSMIKVQHHRDAHMERAQLFKKLSGKRLGCDFVATKFIRRYLDD